MSILHIVRSSAFKTNQLQQCLVLLGNDDRVFLIDDGIYNVSHILLQDIKNLIFVLEPHLTARNIQITNQHHSIASYNDLVKETENAESVITWQ